MCFTGYSGFEFYWWDHADCGVASFVVVENVNPFGDGSSCLVLGGVCQILLSEAYSVAGEIGVSWWLVEHYSAYHVNCPDGCVSGEPARGR